MAESLLVDVLVNLPLKKIFTYKSDKKIKIGSIIKGPFGYNNEIVNAVTITPSYKKKSYYKLKSIISIKSEKVIFSKNQIIFLKWVSKYYLVSLSQVFHSVVPKGIYSIKEEFENRFKSMKYLDSKFTIKLKVENSSKNLKLIFKNLKFNKSKTYQYLILTPNILKSYEIYTLIKEKYNE